MKKFILFCLFLFTASVSFTSCDREEEEIHEYKADIFDSRNGHADERTVIMRSYRKAFEYSKMIKGNGTDYYYSPSRETVLNACSVAEKTIRDAQVDWKGYYVFEMKEDGQRIYFMTYGKLPM